MSHLGFMEKLLDGVKVEWKALGEVAEYSKMRIDFNLVNKENYVGVDNLLQNLAGKTDSSYVPTEGRLIEYRAGDVLIGNIRPYLKKIWYADRAGGTNGDVLVIHPTHEALNFGYLYQVLTDDKFFAYNMQHAKGAKMPRGDKTKILEYTIPIPCSENPEKSLEIQAEIVRILDAFTALTAELSMRKKQYNYYRDQLLSFPRSGVGTQGEVEWKMLGEVAEFRRGTAITQKQTTAGDIPVVANGPTPTYLHGESNRNGETIVIARSGAYAGYVSFWNQPIFLTDAFSVHPDSKILKSKFVFHFLQNKQEHLHTMKKGAGVPHVRVKEFELYDIPIPSLAEQERIVAVLDKFDALTNSITEGLPREIELRQKQYAYYRDLLLSFPKPVPEAPLESVDKQHG